MIDDLKERLWKIERSGCNPYVACRDAAEYITDLEARLASAEAGEDALAEALKSMKETCGFNRQMLVALAAYEARRKG